MSKFGRYFITTQLYPKDCVINLYLAIIEKSLNQSKYKEHTEDLLTHIKGLINKLRIPEELPLLTTLLRTTSEFCDLIDRHQSIQMVKYVLLHELAELLEHCIFCFEMCHEDGDDNYNHSNITGSTWRIERYTKRLNKFYASDDEHNQWDEHTMRLQWQNRGRKRAGRPKKK